MFDNDFLIDQKIWKDVEILFANRFESCSKQVEVSRASASLYIEDLCKETTNENDVFSKLIEWISTLTLLALQCERRNAKQNKF